jgi:hypothetical protein
VSDRKHDSDVTNDTAAGDATVYGTRVSGEWDGYGGSGSVRVGGVDVLRVDPFKDLPGGLSGGSGGFSSGWKMLQGDAEWDELFAIGGGLADLGLNVAVYFADPLNFLISAGLTFLIDVVQPLEDLLGLVTGNPERMDGEIAKWDRVANALEPLAKEVREAAEQGLIGWEGKAASEAKARLIEFAEGVGSVGNDVKQLMYIMSLAKTLMEVAQAFIIGLIATFVEWLVWTWTAALAAAVPTAGASTAAAGAATGVQGALVSSRAAAFITRVVNILKRLRTVLFRKHKDRMHRVKSNFQLRQGGQFVKGWVGTGPALASSLKDWRPYAGAAIKAVSAAGTEGKRAHDHYIGDQESDPDPGRQLDPNR